MGRAYKMNGREEECILMGTPEGKKALGRFKRG
jgi:hypothetical protein